MSLIPLDAPYIWGHPNIQGMAKHMGVSKHMGASKHMKASKHMGAFKHTGGASKHMAASKHTGDIQMYGRYMDTPCLTKHAFFVLGMYRGHPKIIQTYGVHPNTWGCPSIHGTFKHMGHQNVWGGIWGHPKIKGAIQT